LQEHADDDLQVDGPGETDNDADEVTIPPPTTSKQQEPDSAQLAKKIKELIGVKGAPSKKVVIEEQLLERSESLESLKRSDTQSAPRSPSSVSSGLFTLYSY